MSVRQVGGFASPDLLASCWTTAGAVQPFDADERSPEAFADRVKAAAEAGFVGFGLTYVDVIAVRDSIGYAEAASILRDNGMKYLELEMLMDWYGRGPEREAGNLVRDHLFEAARILAPIHVKAGTDYVSHDWDMGDLAREFRELCKRAEGSNTRVSIEPQPMAFIRTPHQAVELVERAGHASGGVLIDIWHVERGGVPMHDLLTVPKELVFGIEFNDAPAEVCGTLLEDTVRNRVFPGEGSFDLQGFIKAIRALDYRGPWGIEIISDASKSLPVREKLAKAFKSASRQFEIASTVEGRPPD